MDCCTPTFLRMKFHLCFIVLLQPFVALGYDGKISLQGTEAEVLGRINYFQVV